MATIKEVVAAYRRIGQAEERYRSVLRGALEQGITQAELAQALGRSREKLRQDAMTEEDRDRIRQANTERKRKVRGAKSW